MCERIKDVGYPPHGIYVSGEEHVYLTSFVFEDFQLGWHN